MIEIKLEPDKCKELLRLLFEKYQGDQPDGGVLSYDVCKSLTWTKGEERRIGKYLCDKELVTRYWHDSNSIRITAQWVYTITEKGIDNYLEWDDLKEAPKQVESWPRIGAKKKESEVHRAESNNIPQSPEKVSREYTTKSQEMTGKINKIVEQEITNRRKILSMLYECWSVYGGKSLSYKDFEHYAELSDMEVSNVVHYLEDEKLISQYYDSETYPPTDSSVVCYFDITRNGIKEVESWPKLEDQSIKPEVPVVKFPIPDGTRWEDIKIQIVSNNSVRIKVNGKKTERRTFVEMGFKDGRRGDLPDSYWNFFIELARHNGQLKEWPQKTNSAVQKRIQIIGKRLQAIFGLKEKPIYRYNKRDGYITKFKMENVSY